MYSSVPRTDFGPPPPGYVAGVGRGAVGFTTRSDIGPARPAEEMQTGQARSRHLPLTLPLTQQQQQQQSKAMTAAALQTDTATATAVADSQEVLTYSDANYDQFSGYSERLFASGSYSAEDREADDIYAAIDRRAAGRKRKRVTESESNNHTASLANASGVINGAASQFADLKHSLATVSASEWLALPEALDYSKHNAIKKRAMKHEKLTAVPDALLAAASADILVAASTSATTMASDLTSVGRARDAMLGLNLDRAADSVLGQSAMDARGYMTDLNAVHVTTTAELADIGKARSLLQSVIQTNPQVPVGYIGLARLERDSGNLAAARAVMRQACSQCPLSEDAWLEAVSVHAGDEARSVMARALQHLPHSIALWERAAQLELSTASQRAVCRRALELLPQSVALWKRAIELEEPSEARVLLRRAVELVPDCAELWIALVKLSDYAEAKLVLNRARKAMPRELQIWIAAAQLEETHGNLANVSAIVARCVSSLETLGMRLTREGWLREAEQCERSNAVHTARAIVRSTASLGVDPRDQRATWLADTESLAARGSLQTARALYTELVACFPNDADLWLNVVQFERQHGDCQTIRETLERSVQQCPQEPILWLMQAKQQWRAADVEGSRATLVLAQSVNPRSVEVWLAAAKLETEHEQLERARDVLAEARRVSGVSERVLVQSVKVSFALSDHSAAHALLMEGLTHFPASHALWLLRALWTRTVGTNSIPATREVYREAAKHCRDAVEIPAEHASFELDVQVTDTARTQSDSDSSTGSGATGSVAVALSRARAVLEAARIRFPKSEQLWFAALQIEQTAAIRARQSSTPPLSAAAAQLLARALQECPTCGAIWEFAIIHAPRTARRQRSFDALQRCPESAAVQTAVARVLWSERQRDKAREWLQRAERAEPAFGDQWAWQLREAHSEEREAVIARCVEAAPSSGSLWLAVSCSERFLAAATRAVLLECEARLTEILPGEPFPSSVPALVPRATGAG